MKERVYGYVPSIIDGTEEVFEASKIELPESYSYIKYLPDVLNQGSKPICVPCSLSAYVDYAANAQKGTNNVNNHVDVNGLFRGNKDGMSIKDALNILKTEGVKTDLGRFYIDRYARIGNVDDLKTAIIANGPCIGAVGVYNSLKQDFWTKTRNDEFQGGHAISFIGYDEDGFIIRNSWGKSYGKKGYWVFPYKDMHLLYELWTIIS